MTLHRRGFLPPSGASGAHLNFLLKARFPLLFDRHLPQSGISTPIMAAEVEKVVAKAAGPDGDLTDEQMEEMLAQATTRLREKENSKALQSSQPQRFVFPKLDAGNLEKPYVVTKGPVAEADKARLLEEKDRPAEGVIRKVEDPVAARQFTAEVRAIFSQFYHIYMRKIFPNFFLEQSRGAVMASFCQHESLFFIVTLTLHSSRTIKVVIGKTAVAD